MKPLNQKLMKLTEKGRFFEDVYRKPLPSDELVSVDEQKKFQKKKTSPLCNWNLNVQEHRIGQSLHVHRNCKITDAKNIRKARAKV